MIISLQLKNFFSIAEEVALDFTAEVSARNKKDIKPENLLEFNNDKFIKIIGLFGGNAAGKSNIIKAIEFCRKLVVESHLYNEGTKYDFSPFKFDPYFPSEFALNFVTEGIEYEYFFSIYDNKILKEGLYYYPNKRRSKIFERSDGRYSYGKGALQRPVEVEANTGDQTLFLSRGSSMNRPVLQKVYRFFLDNILIGNYDVSFNGAAKEDIEKYKPLLLTALEVSDSDIVDMSMSEVSPGRFSLQTFHKENPSIAFDFEKEESEGTKRLFSLLVTLLKAIETDTAIFFDEFDLKLHLRLAEFILDVIRASKKAQFVFTSHNAGLLNRDLLRDEQMVFVTKLPNGMSEFVALSDYKDTGKIDDIQTAYLQGRFDGVPYTGNIKSAIEANFSKR